MVHCSFFTPEFELTGSCCNATAWPLGMLFLGIWVNDRKYLVAIWVWKTPQTPRNGFKMKCKIGKFLRNRLSNFEKKPPEIVWFTVKIRQAKGEILVLTWLFSICGKIWTEVWKEAVLHGKLYLTLANDNRQSVCESLQVSSDCFYTWFRLLQWGGRSSRLLLCSADWC